MNLEIILSIIGLILVGNGNGIGLNSDAFTILKNGKTGVGIDNFETTTSDAILQVNGNISALLPSYLTHADADADTNLKKNDFYRLTDETIFKTDRVVYQKP